MDFLDQVLAGLLVILSLKGILFLTAGVIGGILIGAVPGMSPSMGVALLVPLSYGVDPAFAFILLVAAYQAANYGGSITAIAVNAPGTPASVVTAIDGYELTKKGKASFALRIALFASVFGGLFGAVLLIAFAIPIAKVALKFGPAEYFSLAVFGLVTVIAFSKTEKAKSFVAVLIGLLLSTVGLDPIGGEERFTFGIIELFDGISFIPAMIGMFALGEIFYQIQIGLRNFNSVPDEFGGEGSLAAILYSKVTLVKSALIGYFIGVIPGAGATIASFVSYAEAKRSSSSKAEQAEGEGVIASEAANSSSVGGALVPLLALGIPGSATDAVLLGALNMHGLVAGPELFSTEPTVVYGIFLSVLFANLFILVFGLLGNQIWQRVLKVPKELLFPVLICLCVLGSYSLRGMLFDSWVCLWFGVFGWVLKIVKINPAAVILGLVLGPMIEINLRRGFLMGGPSLFFIKPISLAFLVISFLTIILSFRTKVEKSS